jgi:c-di-GMP-related signal transduction protein
LLQYNLLFKIGTEEVLSSNKHLFSVYDIIENKFEMLEARNINKDKHCLVNYTKDILTPSVK